MWRSNEHQLEDWLKKTSRRKPLIIRGARQVGKSTLVRQFALKMGRDLVEINLERHPLLNKIFEQKEPKVILTEIEAITKKKIDCKNSILFLDEIQATPQAIPTLRYFYEDMPHLPVVAAGSLLEFVLARHNFSMPVGRIQYHYLGPMTFLEFLTALNEKDLLDYLKVASLTQRLPQAAHERLVKRQREYLFVGGMPEVVLSFKETGNLIDCQSVQQTILQTYQDDFSKYAQGPDLQRFHQIMQAMPRIIGKKIKYSDISRDEKSAALRSAVDLLIKARLILPVWHSDCNGVPLASERNERVYKIYFLDVGIFNHLCHAGWERISQQDDERLINEGVLAEQFIAQHLAYRKGSSYGPELYYWLREGKSNNAEIDFAVTHRGRVIPIEVKAGATGTLKSLQYIMATKGLKEAYRFDMNMPSKTHVEHRVKKDIETTQAQFELVSWPLYMIENAPFFGEQNN